MLKNALFVILIFLISCKSENSIKEDSFWRIKGTDRFIIYTQPSILENKYEGFNSVTAINEIAKIENNHLNDFDEQGSQYYGTIWEQNSQLFFHNDSQTIAQHYFENKNRSELDSMHCTIYAMKALEQGLDTNFAEFSQLHTRIYDEHEHAGWSAAYILTKYFNWTAYLFISKSSAEYEQCLNSFQQKKEYPVWAQPNIPLGGMYDFDNQKDEINQLLSQNEFGWGFSYQGWHTWITRFEELKECNWAGSPYIEYGSTSLFQSTPFTSYYAYNSHIIVFPPKE